VPPTLVRGPRTSTARSGLALLGRVLRLIWQTSPSHTLLLLAAVVLNGLIPVARLWVARLIIDGIVAAIRRAWTHDVLVALGGRYAELYDLQAAAYR
jgi:ATP-binding cassette subfamily B protein